MINYDFLRDKCVLVTGGTGSFGQRCIRTLLERSRARRIVVFSRDELKQSQMQVTFAEHADRLRFFLGDVRDAARLERAFHGVNFVIHAAALKQVPALEYNPFEAVQTNIVGTQNVINAAIDQGVEKVLLISTDKAANPANLYGATKLCAEKLCIRGNHYSGGRTQFSAVRYGNVLGSRGSLLQVIEDQRKKGEVTLTHDEMTRFWITLSQGIELVLRSLAIAKGGEIFIPKIPSMRVKELLNVLAPECRIKIIGIRPGEKMHELLITPEEARRTREFDEYYLIYPEFVSETAPVDWLGEGRPIASDFVYSSQTNKYWLDANSLSQLLTSL